VDRRVGWDKPGHFLTCDFCLHKSVFFAFPLQPEQQQTHSQIGPFEPISVRARFFTIGRGWVSFFASRALPKFVKIRQCSIWNQKDRNNFRVAELETSFLADLINTQMLVTRIGFSGGNRSCFKLSLHFFGGDKRKMWQ
jgi:hypothetical protein